MITLEGTVNGVPQYEHTSGDFTIPFHAEKIFTSAEDLKSIAEYFIGKDHRIRYLSGSSLPIIKGNRIKVEMHTFDQVREYYQHYMTRGDNASLWPLSISVFDRDGEEIFSFLDCRRLR